MDSNRLYGLADKLNDRDTAVRKEAARGILSTEMRGPRWLVVRGPTGEKDIRSLAAEELKRSGDLSDVGILAKAYVITVKESMLGLQELSRLYAGCVQKDARNALLAILRRCDTAEKVSGFQRMAHESIPINCKNDLIWLGNAAESVISQLRHSGMDKPLPKQPSGREPKAGRPRRNRV